MTAANTIGFVFITGFLLAVYTIAAIGLAYILGHAVISRGLREWAYGPISQVERDLLALHPGVTLQINSPRRFLVTLVECPACLGFWIGLGSGALFYDTVPLFPTWVVIVGLALYTAGSNLVLGKMLKLME